MRGSKSKGPGAETESMPVKLEFDEHCRQKDRKCVQRNEQSLIIRLVCFGEELVLLLSHVTREL
jgi:hypothetical protein